MKTSILFLMLLSTSVFADEYVQGHLRSDGTYVQGHYRSSQDSNRANNYSEKGNTNPYTGREGTRDSSANQYNNQYNSNQHDSGRRYRNR